MAQDRFDRYHSDNETRITVYNYNEKLGKLLVERFGWPHEEASLIRFAKLIGYESDHMRDD